ncbi:PrsW family intramembrane metalloprotease [Candidatus Peregrinibacteria bacterium]|nr:PrsW family intramembrane metalloprotease [Candidatus Peregrinibacteria bacterium]MBT7484677.1 PrsW family intramembrane metalloprotease [Candidatus Peregrinibacteria bacterium]MBT7703626.1 PrsW family intramembrane metalloprotease [Candidatus Peregrinibacteria bacterium]
MSLFILAIAPSIALIVLFYLRDKYDKEPWGLLVKVFLLGALAIVPVAFIEMGLFWVFGLDPYVPSSLLANLLSALFLVAVIEEGAKFFIVRKFAWKKKAFNEPYDGIMYAVIASLGFATIENILYVLPMGIEIGLLRAFLSVPMHALTAVIMGYYIGLAKYSKDPYVTRHLVKGFVVAVLFHGFFNFFVSSQVEFLIGMAPILIGYAWLVGLRASKWHAENSPFKKK